MYLNMLPIILLTTFCCRLT